MNSVEEAKARARGIGAAQASSVPLPLPVVQPEKTTDKPPGPVRERVYGLVADGPDDGYTLRGECIPTDSKKGRLKFLFRPALPEAVYEYRIRVGDATTGVERVKAAKILLAGHVVSWELMTRGPAGHVIPLEFTPAALDSPKVLRALGAEYIDQMVNFVTGYLAGEWEEDTKNS